MVPALIEQWWKKRKAEKARKRHQEGWNWAAGQLLSGDALATVRGWAEYGMHFDGPNPWDSGILDACIAWEKLA